MKIILIFAVLLGVFGFVVFGLTSSKIDVEAVSVKEEIIPLKAESEERNVRSNTKPLVLVELFTSEGCSSCPPADKNLTYFNDKQPCLCTLIIGIGSAGKTLFLPPNLANGKVITRTPLI